MSRDYLNNVDKIGYGYAEPGSPGHDYGRPRIDHKPVEPYMPTDATLQHEAFLVWLKSKHPKRYLKVRLGHYISTRKWETWQAQWRIAK